MSYRMAALVAAVALASVGCMRASQDAEGAAGNSATDRINGHPNLSGVWLAMNSANWNLEAHSAQAIDQFWQLGSLAAIPAGKSVVVEGKIPYLPDALAQREANKAGWPKADPETLCYLPGIPRANYMPYPFQILQTESDILFVYSYASANRLVASTLLGSSRSPRR